MDFYFLLKQVLPANTFKFIYRFLENIFERNEEMLRLWKEAQELLTSEDSKQFRALPAVEVETVFGEIIANHGFG